MKKALLLVLSLVLLSVSAFAADCDPAAMNTSINEKVAKAQQNTEKFAKIAEPLKAFAAELTALTEKGDTAAICAKLEEVSKLVDSAI